MNIPDDIDSVESAIDVIEDLIGLLQEIHHKLEVTEDLSDYGVAERFMDDIERTLSRYDAWD